MKGVREVIFNDQKEERAENSTAHLYSYGRCLFFASFSTSYTDQSMRQRRGDLFGCPLHRLNRHPPSYCLQATNSIGSWHSGPKTGAGRTLIHYKLYHVNLHLSSHWSKQFLEFFNPMSEGHLYQNYLPLKYARHKMQFAFSSNKCHFKERKTMLN